MLSTRPLPPVYHALGIAGLIPFLAGPVLTLTGYAPFALLMFTTYSLAIACFLSGAWWGLAVARGLTHPAVAAASNLATLAAFGAVVLFEPPLALIVLTGVFVVLVAGDVKVPALQTELRGYRRLRTGLTVVVVGCHLAMLALLPG